MSTFGSKPQTTELPGNKAYWASAIVAMLGVGLSAELTRLHVLVARDPGHQSFCNVSATVNCDAVAKSSYSVLFGLPLSVWGLFAYSAVLVLSVWGIRTRRAAPSVPLFGLGIVTTLGAASLLYVSVAQVHSWCLLCMASWAVDVAILVAGWVQVRSTGLGAAVGDLRHYVQSNRSRVGLVLTSAILALILAGRVVRGAEHQAHAETTTSERSRSGASIGTARHGTDPSGHHYLGAQEPKLTIVEFSDYQCPFCAKSYVMLKDMAARHGDEVRIVHRHFPLDNDCNPAITRPFHQHSCYYARLAACAGTFDKFWPASDYLFEHGRDEAPVALETVARLIGVEAALLRKCVSERGSQLLKPDIEEGGRMNIEGTPTYVINGEVHTGPLPDELLKRYPL